MSGKEPTPVSGGGEGEANPDGVNESEARTAGGESGGGGYDNPHSGKDGDSEATGVLGHGGQSEAGHHGAQGGPEGTATDNATGGDVRGSDQHGERGPRPGPTGPEQDFSAEYPREIEVDGRQLEIIDTSGIAAAEAAGTIGGEGEENAPDAPGSG